MKFVLFVGLFSLLLTASVNARYEGQYLQSSNGIKCEEAFNVSQCNGCQQAQWDSWTSESTCGFFIHLIGNVIEKYIKAAENSDLKPYDMGPYDDGVKETCAADFTCTYDEAEKIWRGVEDKCQDELSVSVDWSADPRTIDRTVASAYGTILFYYFGIPDHDAFCLKAQDGELCGIEYVKPLLDWIKEKFPDGKFIMSFDGKFVYGEDGSKIEVPKELITCGECIEKMEKEYNNWPGQHPLPDYLVKNIFGSWDDVKDFYTCPNDKMKRGLDRLPRRSSGSPGFSRFGLKF